MRRGELERAGELLVPRARGWLTRAGIEGEVCELDAYDAKRLLLTGDPEGAVSLAERIQDDGAAGRRDPVAAGVPGPDHGRGGARPGRRDAGIEHLRESVELAERVDAIYDQALGLDVLAEVTGRGRHRRRAAELFERLGVVAAPEHRVPGREADRHQYLGVAGPTLPA